MWRLEKWDFRGKDGDDYLIRDGGMVEQWRWCLAGVLEGWIGTEGVLE